MSLANVSTARQEYKCINCGEKHASYNKKREFDIQHIRVSIFFPKLVQFIKKLMDRG